MIEVSSGDLVIGAYGVRAATLEAVGSWRDITDDQEVQVLTAAGIIGRVTSRSTYFPKRLSLPIEATSSVTSSECG
ncbi:MAG: hypothetical protein ACPGLY_24310 [Rubripirellula sp.]